MLQLDSVIRTLRRVHPSVLNACPVCGRPVTERDARWRLRGGTYGHRECCTYRVRETASRPYWPLRR